MNYTSIVSMLQTQFSLSPENLLCVKNLQSLIFPIFLTNVCLNIFDEVFVKGLMRTFSILISSVLYSSLNVTTATCIIIHFLCFDVS